jgi:flagellar biosynthesis GTPase FlhF
MAKRSATLLSFPSEAQSPRGALFAALRRHRLPELLIEDLLQRAAEWEGYAPSEALACALAQRMKVEALDLLRARGVLLLGASGAGKSAVAAKIAHAARLAGRPVAQLGAVEGLAALRATAAPGEALTVMEAEGFNPLNARAATALSALGSIAGVDSVGVVSALNDAEDAADIVAALRLKRVIVTGLDRTRRLGALVAAIAGEARLAHVTSGPLPQDGLHDLDPGALARMLLRGGTGA